MTRKCKHDWHWMGGGLGSKYGTDGLKEGQMYCKKECVKCGLKKEIRE